MFFYNMNLSFKEDKLRGKNRIIVRWPRIMAIIFIIIFLGLGGALIPLAIIEQSFDTIGGGIAVIVAILIIEVPLAILALYFCRHHYIFDFESKKLTVYYTLKKKKTYSFDEIKEIIEFPQGVRLYLQGDKKDKKVDAGFALIGASLLPDKFRELGFTVIKKERYR